MTTRDLSFMHDLGINPSTSMCLEFLYCSIGKGNKGKYDPKANEDQSAGVGSRQKERIRVQIRPHDAAGRTISASVSIVTGSETDPFLGSYHLFSRGAPVYFLSTHQQS